MSEDRVRFLVPLARITTARYSSMAKAQKAGVSHKTAPSVYERIVLETLRTTMCEMEGLTRPSPLCASARVVEVVCRPDQFARFIVERDRCGLANWTSEMMPVLEPAKPRENAVATIARKASLYAHEVRRVMDLLGLDDETASNMLSGSAGERVLDVSDR